jgi:hypothetical protein
MAKPDWVEAIRDQRFHGNDYGIIVKLKRGFSFTKFEYNRIKEFSDHEEVNEAIKMKNIYIYNGEREVISVPN